MCSRVERRSWVTYQLLKVMSALDIILMLETKELVLRYGILWLILLFYTILWSSCGVASHQTSLLKGEVYSDDLTGKYQYDPYAIFWNTYPFIVLIEGKMFLFILSEVWWIINGQSMSNLQQTAVRLFSVLRIREVFSVAVSLNSKCLQKSHVHVLYGQFLKITFFNLHGFQNRILTCTFVAHLRLHHIPQLALDLQLLTCF